MENLRLMLRVNRMDDQIEIINGKKVTDDRGSVSFINDFDFKNIKRMYVVDNHKSGFVRAWHGHNHESKYITVLSGAALIAVVPLHAFAFVTWPGGNYDESTIFRRVLSADNPQIIRVPKNFANGAKTLVDGTKILYLSDKTLEESKNDDLRFSAECFRSVWDIIER